MRRYFWFKLAFFTSAVLYIPVKFILSDIADTLVSASFFMSSFYFVYSKDIIPETYLNIPQVHYYYKSHNNSYSYSIAAYLALSALIFGFFALIEFIPFGLISLILWAGFIALIRYLLSDREFHRQQIGIISDFVGQELGESIIDRSEIKKYVKQLYLNKIRPFDSAQGDKSKKLNIKLTKEQKDKIEKLFNKYILETEEKLLSDEVKSIN